MTELEQSGKTPDALDQPIPSKKALFKATAIAALLAAIIFIIAILPAEFGLDPTGLGQVMGLTQLAGQAQPAEAQPVQASTSKQTHPDQEDSVDIIIPAGEGLDYKFYLVSGDTIRYGWSTKGNEEIFFDFHGEPQGDTTGYFESYTVSTVNTIPPTITASFAGSHGWYWENKSYRDIVVTLNTEGSYKIIGIK